MQTDASHLGLADAEGGSVVALWRYPVKSMMGEELNATEVTERGLVGDRQFAVVDPSTGKVAGAKNPRKWGNFFDFRAAYTEPLQRGSKLPAVRVTLPDGAVVTSDQPDLTRVLSGALGREVAFAEAPDAEESPTAQAEEYWPDMEGLEFRDTVTEWELPAGTFFDLAVVHLLTTATIDRLRELVSRRALRGATVSAEHRRLDAAGCARFCRERLDRPDGRDRRRGPPADHRWLSSLRDDHAAAGRPAQGPRHPAYCSTTQSRRCGGLCRCDRGRRHPPRR